MVCPNCGKENQHNGAYCIECGSPLQVSFVSQLEASAQRWSFSSLPSWVYILGGVIVALCLLIGLSHHDESPSPQASQDQTNRANLDRSQGTSDENGSSQTGAESDTSLSVTSAVVATNGEIFAGTNYGLFSSSDLGSTWENVPIKTHHGYSLKFGDVVYVYDSGKNNFIAICVATDSLSMADSLWSLSGSSYYLSHGGKDWLRFFPPSEVFFGHRVSLELSNFAFASNSTIFAVSSYAGKGQVWRSNNGGQSWSNAGLEGQNILSLLVSPQGTLFARISPKFNLSHPDDRNLYRSTNGGANWKRLELQDVRSLIFTGKRTVVAFNAARAHASTSGDITCYHYLSSDDGNEWDEVSDNTFTSGWESVACSDGSILQVGEATINYSGNNSPSGWLLARSQDAGTTWTSAGITSTGASADDNISGCYLWAGSRGYALFIPPSPSNLFYISTDNGESWQRKTLR